MFGIVRPALRTVLLALTLSLSLAPSTPVLADAMTGIDAVERDRSTGAVPWSMVMLLAAFSLTAFVGRGRNRSAN